MKVVFDAARSNDRSGDVSFLEELASLTDSRVQFDFAEPIVGQRVNRKLAGAEEKLAEIMPVPKLREWLLYAARSTRLTKLPPADVVLGHIKIPRARPGAMSIWSSQGINSRDYYRATNRRVTTGDVAAVYRRGSRWVDRLLIWNHAGADRLVSYCPDLMSKVHVLPPMVMDRFSRGSHAPPSPRFLFVGYDWKRKRLRDVVSAFERVVQHGADATLEVVCSIDAPRSPNTRVTYHGPLRRNEVIDLMRSCDILVLPSAAETHGLVIAEGLMMGLGCIVSDAEPLPEVAGDAGLVVPLGDVVELAACMSALADDPNHRQGLRSAARRRYQEVHHPEVFVSSFLGLVGAS